MMVGSRVIHPDSSREEAYFRLCFRMCFAGAAGCIVAPYGLKASDMSFIVLVFGLAA